MFNPELFADNIKKFRKIRGVSQTELARYLGISPQSVSKWESGNSIPDVWNLCALAEFFNISIESLAGTEEKMKKVMIGVDGGGSKTEFVMFDESGNILGRTVLSGCNPNSVGFEEALNILQSGISELSKINLNLKGIYIGSAGFLLSNVSDRIKEKLTDIYPNVKIRCKSDMLNVVASCTDSDKCIGAVCGTGYVAYAKIGDELIRYGGWGYMLEKYGSGYSIGREAMGAALDDIEGTGNKTLLTKLIEDTYKKSADMLIGKAHKCGPSFVAGLAPLVFEAYKKGDCVAEKILKRNAYAVADALNNISLKHKITKNVVLSGSIISADDTYITLIKEKLNKDIECIVPKLPQIYGACRLCAAMCQISDSSFEENFIKGYSSYIN